MQKEETSNQQDTSWPVAGIKNDCPFGPHEFYAETWAAMCADHYRPYWEEYQLEQFKKEILTEHPEFNEK